MYRILVLCSLSALAPGLRRALGPLELLASPELVAASVEAAREFLRAESCLASRRPLSAMVHVVRAFLHDPRYASSRLGAWLAEHARAVVAR